MIKTKNLSIHFGGVKAIDNLSVNFKKGKTTGLIGPNGSGKTTLMNLICGTLKPNEGDIIIDKQSFSHIKPNDLRKLKIARTFQDGRIIKQISVEDNLLLAVGETKLFPAMKQTKIDEKKLHEILRKVKLYDIKTKLAGEISYGQTKLLEMGRILIQDSDVCFFDEPFTGLFPEVTQHISELIKQLKEQKKTIVIIEHNMKIIASLCDEAIVLDYGKLIATGQPKEVFKNKSVQEAYLGK